MLKVRLDFCDFMPGYRKTDNWFYHLLRERFDVQICDNPDFLIFADIRQHVHRVHNCVKIHYCVENFAPDFTICDYTLTCHQMDDPRNLRLPCYALTDSRLLLKDNENVEQIMSSKTKFCGFLASYANKKTHVRNEFFHKLCKYKKVDSAGGALNNVGYRVPLGPGAKLDFLRPYKFNLAFENASLPGYTTEKIVDAMQVRAMPIYWGNREVDREFNSKSFLNYFDFPDEEALIDKIIELDQDDAKYLEYMRQPYFHNNQPNEFFSRKRVLDQFEKIFTTPITPVSARRYRWQIGRWIPVLKNRPQKPIGG
ncbi:MAG TPA: glycosyltransferase family 10 [Candidatus Cybelea sp.]|jgi:hypothetical protein|nr:glycosyltransferase family 10 [Candidatus Cybelea sp.]